MKPLWTELRGTLSQTEASFPPRRKGLRIQRKTEGLAPKVLSVAWLVLQGTCKQFPRVWEVGEKVQLLFVFGSKGLHTDSKIQAIGIADWTPRTTPPDSSAQVIGK